MESPRLANSSFLWRGFVSAMVRSPGLLDAKLVSYGWFHCTRTGTSWAIWHYYSPAAANTQRIPKSVRGFSVILPEDAGVAKWPASVFIFACLACGVLQCLAERS